MARNIKAPRTTSAMLKVRSCLCDSLDSFGARCSVDSLGSGERQSHDNYAKNNVKCICDVSSQHWEENQKYLEECEPDDKIKHRPSFQMMIHSLVHILIRSDLSRDYDPHD